MEFVGGDNCFSSDLQRDKGSDQNNVKEGICFAFAFAFSDLHEVAFESDVIDGC